MREFGKSYAQPVVVWAADAHSKSSGEQIITELQKNISFTGDQSINEVLFKLYPDLFNIFCKGAPMVVTTNVNPSLGIANGTDGTLEFLSWESDEKEYAAKTYIEEQFNIHGKGALIFLPLSLRPNNVLFRPQLSRHHQDKWPSDLSASEVDIIIPAIQQNDQLSLTVGSGRPRTVSASRFQFDLAFASTVHKVQGKSLDSVILNLLKRVGNPPRENLASFYVMMSRVKIATKFKILGLVDDLDFVKHLRIDRNYQLFMSAYDDNGKWSDSFLQQACRDIPVAEPTSKGKSGEKRKNTGDGNSSSNKRKGSKTNSKSNSKSNNSNSNSNSNSNNQNSEHVTTNFGIIITRGHIDTLKPGKWLVDQVINFYCCLLQQTEDSLHFNDEARRESVFYKTFFYDPIDQP